MAGAHLCVTEFAVFRRRHLAAQLRSHGLHAITDAEHRYTNTEHGIRCGQRIRGRNGFRPAGEDNAIGLERGDVAVIHITGMNLAVNTSLAHAARNQLRVLRPEIQDQYLVRMNIMHRSFSSYLIKYISHRDTEHTEGLYFCES